MAELIPLLMFLAVCLLLMAGYPVALTLSGTALLFAGIGIPGGYFEPALLGAIPSRLYGVMTNVTLIAVPLFVFMGITLERSRIAEELLENMSAVFGRLPGGLCYAVILVGALLAASTGIVGATVVTMGLMSLPSMTRSGYDTGLASGTICATGTLGQIIPPSIALVLLGDILATAYQQSQLDQGIFNPQSISVGDLFVGAILPGLLLVFLYMLYVFISTQRNPGRAPATTEGPRVTAKQLVAGLMPPVLLIFVVLGSILAGIATPTEAAGVGSFGALILAASKRKLSLSLLRDTGRGTLEVTSMVFLILIGATLFSLVFRGYGGDDLVQRLFLDMPGGETGAILVVMLTIFFLGFILDFIEITFVVVPIVAPILFTMGIDPVWLGIMIAVNLQTSFLTPPFGFALFYLRGVAPGTLDTLALYRGVMPFIAIQIMLLFAMSIWPQLVTWLPDRVYNT